MPWACDIIDDNTQVYGYPLTTSEHIEIEHDVQSITYCIDSTSAYYEK